MEKLKGLIDFVAEDVKQLSGVISTNGFVALDCNKFSTIISDERVFCLDGITEILMENFKDTMQDIVFKETNDLFWYVEDYWL